MRTFFTWLIILPLLLGLAGAVWLGYYFYTPVTGAEEVQLIIKKGSWIRSIKGELAAQGIIKDDVRFLILVRLLRMAGNDVQLRAGEFLIKQGQSPLQVLLFLQTAKPVQYRVTIPEGRTMAQIGAIFADKGWADADTFLQLCRDQKFIQSLGISISISGKNLEGYLFPETYTLVRGEVDEESLIKAMVRRFDLVWNELQQGEEAEENSEPAVKKGRISGPASMNRHQLVTLASIVEKETGFSGERATIAGVFYNRLRVGMRLQSDPTTIYGLQNFNGNLTRADLKKETPYNTYTIAGLPPGPISNPGRAALTAVLQPEKVPYYYFVSQNDGSHYFSKNLQEHNRAVYKFQKVRKNRVKNREQKK